jgi:aminodeoxyfutalosine synthase
MQIVIEDPLLLAVREKVEAGARLSLEDGAALYRTFDILALGYLANLVRERLHGNRTFYHWPDRDDGRESRLEFGAGESSEDRTRRLIDLRGRQDRTGEFNSFLAATLKADDSGFDVLKNIAVPRLILDNILNIKADWTVVTPRMAQIALRFGADSLTGPAGAGGLRQLICKAGREPVEMADSQLRVLA